jgi:Caspase domain
MRLRHWTTEALRSLGCVIVAAAFVAVSTSTSLRAEALVFHASQPGKQTLDEGEGGGNPFASALIELLGRPSLALAQLPAELKQLTAKKSGNFQSADVPEAGSRGNVSLVPTTPGEMRIALVMVVSDYTQSDGAESLPGARLDAERIAAALNRAGFATEIALDLGLDAMRNKLADFRAQSMISDMAIIYTTGHGVEVAGTTFLIPGDYPVKSGNSALARKALPLPEIALSPAARQVNLVFYGGCRDNPFGQ